MFCCLSRMKTYPAPARLDASLQDELREGALCTPHNFA
jgi:hypothetical protein